MSAPYLTKNLMVMRRGGKIGGYFSQYTASWSQLTQCEDAMMTLGSLFKEMCIRDRNSSVIVSGGEEV